MPSSWRILISKGEIPPPVAARLIEFIPMVYCRLLLEGTGVRFPIFSMAVAALAVALEHKLLYSCISLLY